MEKTSINEKLYEFIEEYNLIQVQTKKEDVLSLLQKSSSQLNENEEILTCFFASSGSKDEQSPRLFMVTNANRLITQSEKEPELIELPVDSIKRIYNGDEQNKTQLFIETEKDSHQINALNASGVDSINDALYSAIGELLPEEKVNQIFIENDLEEPVLEPQAKSESSPKETKKQVEAKEESKKEENPTTEEIIVTENPEEKKNTEQAKTNKVTASDLINAGPIESETTIDYEPAATTETKKTKKTINLNKPLLYILGAAFIVILAVISFNVFRFFAQESESNNAAKTLIDYFNQVDEVYTQANDYAKAGLGKSTVDQWNALDEKAKTIEKEINEQTFPEDTASLRNAVYYYNELMITAVTYGKNFAQTSNPFDQYKVTHNLEQAELNRQAVLGIIDSDFPKLIDSVKDQQGPNGQNSKASDEQNSRSSDEQNSKSSDE